MKLDKTKYLKLGTTGYFNHFGISILAILFLILNVSRKEILNWEFNNNIYILFFGIFFFLLQLRRLKFKKLKLNISNNEFRQKLKEVIPKLDWIVTLNTPENFKANYNSGLISNEMLIMKLKDEVVEYCFIYDPENKGSILSTFSPKLESRNLCSILNKIAKQSALKV